VADIVFHLAEPDDWARRADSYVPRGFEDEGFIHCSTAAQLEQVVRSFYPDRNDLVRLTIETVAVADLLVYEDLYEANELFPHIYGAIPLQAIVEATHHVGA